MFLLLYPYLYYALDISIYISLSIFFFNFDLFHNTISPFLYALTLVLRNYFHVCMLFGCEIEISFHSYDSPFLFIIILSLPYANVCFASKTVFSEY